MTYTVVTQFQETDQAPHSIVDVIGVWLTVHTDANDNVAFAKSLLGRRLIGAAFVGQHQPILGDSCYGKFADGVLTVHRAQ